MRQVPLDPRDPAPLALKLQRHPLARIDAYDAVSSRFRPDSLVTRVANTSGGSTFTFPDLAATVFGLYDILDYDADYTLHPARCRRSRGRGGRA
ncbi:hypothetical protein ACFTXM_05730 [Streptomyces sp. NPDC056930]|uniref:hypothetical protein n=1 Tax=Streptomyces sp. NPDC056930 TaxID=3345967 RepID=UPI0036304DDB